jgi:hypothetical protein
MSILGQASYESTDHLGSRRAWTDLVRIIKDETHVDRRIPGQGISQCCDEVRPTALQPERGEQPHAEDIGIDVTGNAVMPNIDTHRLDRIGPNRLGEQRRLAKTGIRYHDGDRVFPPLGDPHEQTVPIKLVRERQGKPGWSRHHSGAGSHGWSSTAFVADDKCHGQRSKVTAYDIPSFHLDKICRPTMRLALR